MKCSEFRRWLQAQGVTLTLAKGSLGDRRSIFADHGSKEIGEGVRQKILKDLGLKD